MQATLENIAFLLLVKPDALAISLAKGMHVAKDGPQLISQMIRRSVCSALLLQKAQRLCKDKQARHRGALLRNLGLDCSVLMGGNVAVDVGKHQLSEAVVAAQSEEIGQIFKKLFECSYFNVDTMRDVHCASATTLLRNHLKCETMAMLLSKILEQRCVAP
eukprot:1137762-Pelagomonas_calceolata.AAC.8